MLRIINTWIAICLVGCATAQSLLITDTMFNRTRRLQQDLTRVVTQNKLLDSQNRDLRGKLDTATRDIVVAKQEIRATDVSVFEVPAYLYGLLLVALLIVSVKYLIVKHQLRSHDRYKT